MKSLLFEQFIKPLAKEIFSIVTSIKINTKVFEIDQLNIEEALSQHVNKVSTFMSEVSFKELMKPKSLSSIYIHLDLSLSKIVDKEEQVLNQSAIKVIEDVFVNTNNNVVLKGSPGAGKTTTLKHICQKILIEEEFLGEKINFPILIRFREDEILINPEIPLFEYILNVLGIIIHNKDFPPITKESKAQIDLIKKQTAIQILDRLSPLLILDGIDEVPDDSIKNKLIKNINEVSLTAKNSKFILTTRKGDDLFHIENTQSFELAPLSEPQQRTFVENWLGNDKGLDFMRQLYNSSVFDAAKRPLNLSHLCAIFEREGKIPEKSKSIYRKIVNLVISDWNLENQIHKTSKFADFDPDRKKEFLENLAFELSFNFNKYQFTKVDLQTCYYNLHSKYNLPGLELKNVINEIQVHNGLINQIGDEKFEFAHKSFQEYLAAEYIVRLPKLPMVYNLLRNPAEMALAITLSSEPTEYFCYFVDSFLLVNKVDNDFLKSFFFRINIEKPDFSPSNLLAFSILKLHNKYLLNMLSLEESDLTFIEEIFEYLYPFENIKSSFIDLGRNLLLYAKKEKDGEFIKITANEGDPQKTEVFLVTQKFFKQYFIFFDKSLER